MVDIFRVSIIHRNLLPLAQVIWKEAGNDPLLDVEDENEVEVEEGEENHVGRENPFQDPGLVQAPDSVDEGDHRPVVENSLVVVLRQDVEHLLQLFFVPHEVQLYSLDYHVLGRL